MKLSFMGLLILIIVVGGAVGGAYGAGMAVGKGSVSLPPQAQAVLGAGDLASAAAARGGAAGAGASGGAAAFAAGGAVAYGAGGSAVMGTVEKLEGNTLTVSTQGGGTTQVGLADSTVVRKLADAPKDELKQGVRVVVTGQQGAGGAVTASSIQIIPADGASATPGQTPEKPGRTRQQGASQDTP